MRHSRHVEELFEWKPDIRNDFFLLSQLQLQTIISITQCKSLLINGPLLISEFELLRAYDIAVSFRFAGLFEECSQKGIRVFLIGEVCDRGQTDIEKGIV